MKRIPKVQGRSQDEAYKKERNPKSKVEVEANLQKKNKSKVDAEVEALQKKIINSQGRNQTKYLQERKSKVEIESKYIQKKK